MRQTRSAVVLLLAILSPILAHSNGTLRIG